MGERNRAVRTICVKGTSGAGKTTFAIELARRLGVTCIELDSLHWGPNWSQPTNEEFRARVCEAMAATPGGWIIDGNYDSKLGGIVVDEADTIVWLDLPFQVKAWRLWRRTCHRLRTGAELWNGNRESWGEVFASRDSIFLWMIRAHRKHRRDWPIRFGGDPRVVRLRSDRDVQRWLDEQSGVTESVR